MGIYSDKSTTRIVTDDNFKIEIEHETRELAFEFLNFYLKDVKYKVAEIVDTNTGHVVVALRSVK